MNKTATPDTVSGKKFSDQLATDFERGQLDHDLTSDLNTLVKAVRATGKKGKIRLTIEVKPCDLNASQVEISNDITLALPRAPRQRTLAFTTEAGTLQREDPRQMGLEGII
jgi:nitrogen fixation protein